MIELGSYEIDSFSWRPLSFEELRGLAADGGSAERRAVNLNIRRAGERQRIRDDLGAGGCSSHYRR